MKKSHKAAVMAAAFLRAKYYNAAVLDIKALRPDLPVAQQTGLAAYIWYQRQMRRSTEYTSKAFLCSVAELNGWLPVCPQRLASVRQSTIDKWAAFYA